MSAAFSAFRVELISQRIANESMNSDVLSLSSDFVRSASKVCFSADILYANHPFIAGTKGTKT